MKTIKTLMPIPAKYKWITVDKDGLVCIWTKKPTPSDNYWYSIDGHMEYLYKINSPKDWTKAIWRIEEYEEVL